MKKLLTLLTAGIIAGSSLMAYEGGTFFYSPKKYTKSDYFSLEMSAKYINYEDANGTTGGDLGVDFGISKRYVGYIGSTNITYGIKGAIKLTGVNINDNSLFFTTGEVGPILGYDVTRKTNIHIEGGYFAAWSKNFDSGTTDTRTGPYYGIGADFYLNDDLIVFVEGKQFIDSENTDNNAYTIRTGLRFPFWN